MIQRGDLQDLMLNLLALQVLKGFVCTWELKELQIYQNVRRTVHIDSFLG